MSIYHCSDCGRIFHDRATFTDHDCPVQHWTCARCWADFPTCQALADHLQADHKVADTVSGTGKVAARLLLLLVLIVAGMQLATVVWPASFVLLIAAAAYIARLVGLANAWLDRREAE